MRFFCFHLMPWAYLPAVLPSCGHLPYVEQPEPLATTVLKFLEQIGADSPSRGLPASDSAFERQR